LDQWKTHNEIRRRALPPYWQFLHAASLHISVSHYCECI
jgi:hypothetical protein